MKTLLWATTLSLALLGPARAHSEALSEASALSLLPMAVSVAVPVGLVMTSAAFTVVTVTAVSEGTVWVLERISDGARISVSFSGAVVGGASLAAGTAVVAVASAAGWVLAAAGRAIAVIPNEVGKTLLYSERVTR